MSALILAAGAGARMGDRPKAFLKAGGRTLVERAVDQVRSFAAEIILGVSERHLERANRLVEGRPVKVVTGGATRQETLERLLAQATRPVILLHEVARPLVPAPLFSDVLAAADSFGAAAPFLPASRRDSVALREGDFLGAPLPRDEVVATQTPQAFDTELLVAVLDAARREGWRETSAAALCVRAGRSVRLVPGDRANVKITFPEDWKAVRPKLLKSDRDGRDR